MKRTAVVLSLLAVSTMFMVFGGSWAQNREDQKSDEEALRQGTSAYAEAFNQGDVDKIMSFFADDADFLDEAGNYYEGKEEIRERFESVLKDLKGYQLGLKPVKMRFFQSDVCVQDGEATLKSPDGDVEINRFVAVSVRKDGKWRIASVRDVVGESYPVPVSLEDRLKSLEWLVGDWVSNDADASVRLHAEWGPNKSSLNQTHFMKSGEKSELAVWQRIGWDPVNDRVKSWYHDSRGGYGEGIWLIDADRYIIDSTGVLPDGREASARFILKKIDDHQFQWESVGREVNGQPVTDVSVKFVREPKKNKESK